MTRTVTTWQTSPDLIIRDSWMLVQFTIVIIIKIFLLNIITRHNFYCQFAMRYSEFKLNCSKKHILRKKLKKRTAHLNEQTIRICENKDIKWRGHCSKKSTSSTIFQKESILYLLGLIGYFIIVRQQHWQTGTDLIV